MLFEAIECIIPVLIGAVAVVAPVSSMLIDSTPISIAVVAPADLSESLLGGIFAEAASIWEPAGITFEWQRVASADAGRKSQLTVTIENPRDEHATLEAPLGWISFVAGTPDRWIHLSQASAEELIRRTPTALDTTLGAHERLVGRALGRAFAHELGHYLLKSKAHTPLGLMRAKWPSEQFLSVGRRGFELPPDLRECRDAVRFRLWLSPP